MSNLADQSVETVTVSVRTPNAHERQLKRQAAALWEADRTALIVRQPFVALLAMRLDLVPVIDSRLKTACTDGHHVFVNARFLQRLTPQERIFVLGHEVWHCAALHFLRQGNRQTQRWNVAIDHEVNALLKSEGMRLPPGCIYFREHDGNNAETVYASEACAKICDNGERGRLADQHELSEQVSDGTAEIVCDSDFAPQASNAVRQSWPVRVVAVAQQLARQRGHLPGSIQRLVDRYQKPQLPWREILRQFVGRVVNGDRQWMPPNRRFVSQGLYLPGRRQDRLSIAVAIDTSGSTQPELEHFLSELMGIVSSFGRYQLRLLMCDADIQRDDIYTDAEPLVPNRLSFDGAGGTRFEPVFERLSEDESPRALVFFTDGFGSAPDSPPAYPVLWVLTAGGTRPASWGDALKLDRANR